MRKDSRQLVERVIKIFRDYGDNKEITYANGNDGTDFDWEANDRLCEFGTENDYYPDYYKSKLCINRDGSIDLFTFNNPDDVQDCVWYRNEDVFTKDETEKLRRIMNYYADDRGIWDEKLSVIFGMEA